MVDLGEGIVSKRHNYGEDCTSCRLVSGFGILGMGAYVLTAAKYQKTPMTKNLVYGISLVVFGIGAARLLELPPFRRTINKEN